MSDASLYQRYFLAKTTGYISSSRSQSTKFSSKQFSNEQNCFNALGVNLIGRNSRKLHMRIFPSEAQTHFPKPLASLLESGSQRSFHMLKVTR